MRRAGWRAIRALVAAALGAAVGPGAIAAQGIEGKIGRFYQDEGWTLYRAGLNRPLAGPLSTTIHGDYLRRDGDAPGAFAGVGLDLNAFRGGGPYLVAGLAAGMGSPHSQSFASTWTAWSAGGGYELVPASFLRMGVEMRYREISLDQRRGLELAAGLSVSLGGAGGRRGTSKEGAPDGDAALGPPVRDIGPAGTGDVGTGSRPARSVTSRLADSVIATATEVMGRRYQYGGTGGDGQGFDCSGLIQFAYGRHGIALPRRSVDQARQGKKVRKEVPALRPGDLLTFSNRGGVVTHVGLYMGDRRFIHSATRGVQVSTLSAEDPYGRWWYTRWVGARRIVE